jgi:Conjugative transposon protein TcpC
MSSRVVVTSVPMRKLRLGARAPRVALFATLGVLCLAGVRGIVSPPTGKVASVAPAPQQDIAVEQFAAQFVRGYLTYSAGNAEVHQGAIANYLNQTVGSDAGFDAGASHGSQTVLWTAPLQDQPALAGGRIVTVAAQTSTSATPTYMAVNVRRLGDGSLALGGYPSFVGAPQANASYAPPVRQDVADGQLKDVATRVVTNYLGGNSQDLAADVVPGARVTLPTQALHVTQVQAVQSTGPGGVLITAVAQDSRGANYTLSYELGVTRRERWYATSIEVFPNQS